MKNVQSIARRANSAVSVLALTAMATVASAGLQPASADIGIYGGGSSLFSVAFRQLANCYRGKTPDGIKVKSPACWVQGHPKMKVEGLYASVGSGAGRRAFLSNSPFQLVGGSASPFSLPAILPLYLDTTGLLPKVYPYPEMDFAASDDPLPATLSTTPFTGWSPASGWENLAPPPATPLTAVLGTAVTYSNAKYGAPIQLPVAEVSTAIVVNAPKPVASPWQISYNAGNGIAMHLSQPQLCAIFSATVTNWNDSTTSISYLTAANTLASQLFRAGNTTSQKAYTSSSLPITVAYRSDGSGTTFILTNFLSSVCPQFDDGSNKYTQIFAPSAADITAGYKAQPTTRFTDLMDNIKKAFPARTTTVNTWIGAVGTGAVTAAVGNNTADPAQSGRIGYVSTDFAKPYNTDVHAPFAVAVQDEAQRLAGVYTPSAASPFIAPTPAATDLAWQELPVPSSTNYTDWNVYSPKHTVFGSKSLSILATPTTVGAYPLSGTTFMFLYSCYGNRTGVATAAVRTTTITNFMSWLLAGSAPLSYPPGWPNTSTRNAPAYDPLVKSILNANGFNPIPASFATNLIDNFVSNAPGSHPHAIAAFDWYNPQVDGCVGVAGGGAR